MAEFIVCEWPECSQLASVRCSCEPISVCNAHLTSHLAKHQGGSIDPLTLPLTDAEASQLLYIRDLLHCSVDEDPLLQVTQPIATALARLHQSVAANIYQKSESLERVKDMLSHIAAVRTIPLGSAVGARLADWKQSGRVTDAELVSQLSSLASSGHTEFPILERAESLEPAEALFKTLKELAEHPEQQKHVGQHLTPDAQATLLKVVELSALIPQASGSALTLLKHSGLSLKNRDFSGIVASGADFEKADLSNSDFSRSRLLNCKLDEARVQNTSFIKCDLFGSTVNVPVLMTRVYSTKKQPIWTVSVSLCSSFLAAGSACGRLYLANLNEDRLIKCWNAHLSSIRAVAFSPCSELLASCSSDRAIKIWSTQNQQLLAEFTGHTAVVNSIAFAPREGKIVSASDDGTVKEWHLRTGRVIQVFSESFQKYRVARYSPDEKWIGAGSRSGTVTLFHGGNGKKSYLNRHIAEVWALDIAPDGSQLISGGEDQVIAIWNTESCSVIKILHVHSGPIRSLAYSNCGTYILSGSADKTVCVSSVETGQLWVRNQYQCQVTSVVWVGFTKLIACGDMSGNITVQSRDTFESTGLPTKEIVA